MRADNLPRRWCLRDKDGSSHEFEVPVRLAANDPHALHRMVLNGAGIAATASYVALPEIELGTLVRLLREWTVPPVDVRLVMPPGRERTAATRAFLDFVRREIAGNLRWSERRLRDRCRAMSDLLTAAVIEGKVRRGRAGPLWRP